MKNYVKIEKLSVKDAKKHDAKWLRVDHKEMPLNDESMANEWTRIRAGIVELLSQKKKLLLQLRNTNDNIKTGYLFEEENKDFQLGLKGLKGKTKTAFRKRLAQLDKMEKSLKDDCKELEK